MSAGHSRDQERRPEALTQKGRIERDVALVDVRQRLVQQMDVVPPRRHPSLDVPQRRKPQMIRLALLDQLIHAPVGIPLAPEQAASDRGTERRPRTSLTHLRRAAIAGPHAVEYFSHALEAGSNRGTE